MEKDLNFRATELRLALPGRDTAENDIASTAKNYKRALDGGTKSSSSSSNSALGGGRGAAPAPKALIVGWPPVRSYRKNNIPAAVKSDSETGIFVKVSVDGAPYLRKIDLKVYDGYPELIKALENMFKLNIGEYSEREGYRGSEYAPAYEDKDGDLMLVGDVPWQMFTLSCKRLRIIRGSEALHEMTIPSSSFSFSRN